MEEQKIVNDIIYNELTFGKILDSSRLAYLKIIEKIEQEEHIEGIILGCTEIPLLIKQNHTKLKVFDTTEIHALSAVDFALENK